MKGKRIIPVVLTVLLALALAGSAFALDEADVQTAIANSSREQVAGNVFIWFLCAISFLKISQKIDNFMSSLGINVGRTGGSMLSELLIAGRAFSGVAGGGVRGFSNFFHRSSSASAGTPAGQAFTGRGGGLVGKVQRAAGNAAAGSATGTASGVRGAVGSALLDNSLQKNGKFGIGVIGAVATGSIASVGLMKGDRAAQALSSYLGYDNKDAGPTALATSAVGEEAYPMADGAGASIPQGPLSQEADQPGQVRMPQDEITLDGGKAAAGASAAQGSVGTPPKQAHAPGSVPLQPPTFSNVEIGGGRITGIETPAGGGEARQFAMYNAGQYMEPTGDYEVVQTVDGESWYKQYAAPTVQKTPVEVTDQGVKYDEKIVQQMPQIPRRKDKV